MSSSFAPRSPSSSATVKTSSRPTGGRRRRVAGGELGQDGDRRLVVGAEDRLAAAAKDAVVEHHLDRALVGNGVEVGAEHHPAVAASPGIRAIRLPAPARAGPGGTVLLDLDAELAQLGSTRRRPPARRRSGSRSRRAARSGRAFAGRAPRRCPSARGYGRARRWWRPRCGRGSTPGPWRSPPGHGVATSRGAAAARPREAPDRLRERPGQLHRHPPVLGRIVVPPRDVHLLDIRLGEPCAGDQLPDPLRVGQGEDAGGARLRRRDMARSTSTIPATEAHGLRSGAVQTEKLSRPPSRSTRRVSASAAAGSAISM